VDGGHTLRSEWTFDSRVFRPDTIERLQTRYITLLENVAAHPEARVHDLELLPPQEKVALDQTKRNLKGASRRKFVDSLQLAGGLNTD
jgi:non-ribosomal peptide synthetase component F